MDPHLVPTDALGLLVEGGEDVAQARRVAFGQDGLTEHLQDMLEADETPMEHVPHEFAAGIAGKAPDVVRGRDRVRADALVQGYLGNPAKASPFRVRALVRRDPKHANRSGGHAIHAKMIHPAEAAAASTDSEVIDLCGQLAGRLDIADGDGPTLEQGARKLSASDYCIGFRVGASLALTPACRFGLALDDRRLHGLGHPSVAQAERPDLEALARVPGCRGDCAPVDAGAVLAVLVLDADRGAIHYHFRMQSRDLRMIQRHVAGLGPADPEGAAALERAPLVPAGLLP